jgi:hypothetical protein
MSREEVDATQIVDYLNDQLEENEETRGCRITNIHIGGKDSDGCNWTPSKLEMNDNPNCTFHASNIVNEARRLFNAITPNMDVRPKKSKSNSISGSLQRNKVPDEFWGVLGDMPCNILSVDVNENQTKQVIAIENIEAMEYPEIWIYDNAGNSKQIDNKLLEYSYLSKAIWAENEIDIIYEEKEGNIGILYISEKDGIAEGSGTPEVDKYIKERLKKVIDLTA